VGTRDEAGWDAGVVEVEFVSGDGVWGQFGAWGDEDGVALDPIEVSGSNGDAAEDGLGRQVAGEMEVLGKAVAGEEEGGGIESEEVLAIERAVVVTGAGYGFAEPLWVVAIDEEGEFEVEVGAVFGDAGGGVGGASHFSDRLAGDDGFAGSEVRIDFGEVGIEGVEVEIIQAVLEDDVDPVIGQTGAMVDVGDRAIGGGEDRVGRFTFAVALEAADIDAFVHLSAAGSGATEHAMGVGMAGGADKELLFLSGLEQCGIGGGEEERGLRGCGGGGGAGGSGCWRVAGGEEDR